MDQDILRILNESDEKEEFLAVPNKVLAKLSDVQIFSNVLDGFDEGLIMDNLSDQDEDCIEYIKNAENHGIVKILDDEVFILDNIPVKIDFSKILKSLDPHFSKSYSVIYLDPTTYEEIFEDELYDLEDSNEKYFKVKISDLSNEQIKDLIMFHKDNFSLEDIKRMLNKLSKDEIIELFYE